MILFSEPGIEINASTVASQIELALSLLIAALTIVRVGSYSDMDSEFDRWLVFVRFRYAALEFFSPPIYCPNFYPH